MHKRPTWPASLLVKTPIDTRPGTSHDRLVESVCQGLSYRAFLDAFATSAQEQALGRDARAVRPDRGTGGAARQLHAAMPVLCLAGAWCGDCINQCPVFDHFARASSVIDLRFLDRDALPEVREALDDQRRPARARWSSS